MPERERYVAVGLLTGAEFARWGDKLRNVYLVEENPEFDELLRAIDAATRHCEQQSLRRASDADL